MRIPPSFTSGSPGLKAPWEQVPETDADRLVWLQQRWTRPIGQPTRASLSRWYGPEEANRVQHAEAFEVCEYGSQPDEAAIRQLFPMVK